MNALQGETNLISDNCVTWADVAECDRAAALEWLWKRKASAQLEKVHGKWDAVRRTVGNGPELDIVDW